jgi:iron complex transport system permease protein
MKRLLPWLLLPISAVVFGLCLLLGPHAIGIPEGPILQIRLTRTLAGFLTGGALAVAGTVMQALLRNPLAEPYVLGISGGAGMGAAAAMVIGPVWWFAGVIPPALMIPVAAFVGALLTLIAVYSLAQSSGKISVYGLILSGVIVSSLCSNAIMAFIALYPRDGLPGVIWWMLGNLELSSTPLLVTNGALILAGVASLQMLAHHLNAMTLGRDMAHHVGIRTGLTVTMGLVLATLITAAAVSMSGLIGFIGLIVPHVMRSLVGPDHRRLIPSSLLGGGCFLALCDALARTLLRPQEIPVGVVTALFGGPFFLYILRRRKQEGWVE